MSRRRRPPTADTVGLLVGLAAAVRVLRAGERLTQAEVARRAGVSANFVGMIENVRANPTVSQVGQLATGLGLSGARELMNRAEETARLIATGTLPPPG